MPAAKYVVDLTEEERERLLQFIRKGKPGARKVARANTLLLADEGRTDREVADALHIGTATVGRIRKRFVEEGLEVALAECPRPGQRPKLTGKEEAHLIAVACSDPPEGHAGPCGSWRTRRWNWDWPTPLPGRRCARFSKSRPQALAEETMVHPRGKRRIRGPHGGYPGPVRGTL